MSARRVILVAGLALTAAGCALIGQQAWLCAKAALAANTVTWSQEFKRFGIRVGAIAPGYINTEMVAKIREDILEKLIAQIPVGRLGDMSEISRTVQFIIENDYVNGRNIEVDGAMRL